MLCEQHPAIIVFGYIDTWWLSGTIEEGSLLSQGICLQRKLKKQEILGSLLVLLCCHAGRTKPGYGFKES
jgi:hypothetical protein